MFHEKNKKMAFLTSASALRVCIGVIEENDRANFYAKTTLDESIYYLKHACRRTYFSSGQMRPTLLPLLVWGLINTSKSKSMRMSKQ